MTITYDSHENVGKKRLSSWSRDYASIMLHIRSNGYQLAVRNKFPSSSDTLAQVHISIENVSSMRMYSAER